MFFLILFFIHMHFYFLYKLVLTATFAKNKENKIRCYMFEEKNAYPITESSEKNLNIKKYN